ncbi:MAG TPA: hypothetical protein VF918_02365, partial [Anaerolineales bacterium]
GPENYYPLVAEEKILPYHSEIECFSHETVQLKNGVVIPCDVVILSTGYLTPTFPFLPEKYRSILEAEKDGPPTLQTFDPSTHSAACLCWFQSWIYAHSCG